MTDSSKVIKCKECGARVDRDLALERGKCPECKVALQCVECPNGHKWVYDYEGKSCPICGGPPSKEGC